MIARLRSTGLLLAALFALCGFSGCPENITPPTTGTYDGFVIEGSSQPARQSLINAYLVKVDDGMYRLTIRKPPVGTGWYMEIGYSNQSLAVGDPWGGPQFNLQKDDGGCFSSSTEERSAKLCYSASEVRLDLQYANKQKNLIIVANPASRAELPRFEKAANYTKNQLIDLAINQGFSGRIAFQKVVGAQLNARAALLDLAPHVNINTISYALSPSISSMLKALGDIAPFMLPDRWFKVDQAKNEYRAQYCAWMVMKADAGRITENLALNVLSAQESQAALNSNNTILKEIRDQIKERESTGIVQVGSSDDIVAVINSTQQAGTLLDVIRDTQSHALSESAGFINPDAIKQLLMTKFPSRKLPDTKLLQRVALERSFEIRQIDDLVDAARADEKIRTFEWLDPNGKDEASLGLALPTYVKIAGAYIGELMAKREETQSLILQRLSQAIDQLKLAGQQMALAQAGRKVEDQRILRVATNIQLGIGYELADLVSALQGRVKDDLTMVDAKYSALNAWSQIDRLTYTGPYSSFTDNQAVWEKLYFREMSLFGE